MEAHFKLSDRIFESQFENLTLDPKLFTHEAHLRLAWIHINKYGIRSAIKNICHQIKAFASYHGDHAKYNETVTVAAIRAVYHFSLKSPTSSFKDFITDSPRLKFKFKELLDSHYSWDIFNLELAKKVYLEPDIQPFDQMA